MYDRDSSKGNVYAPKLVQLLNQNILLLSNNCWEACWEVYRPLVSIITALYQSASVENDLN